MLTCYSKKAPSSPTSHALTEENFPSFIAAPGTVNIVGFSASWCEPCQQLKPVLRAVADDYPDDVQLGIVDLDDLTLRLVNTNHPISIEIYFRVRLGREVGKKRVFQHIEKPEGFIIENVSLGDFFSDNRVAGVFHV
jgi:thiol-disulfide isomerase/thioredoxin